MGGSGSFNNGNTKAPPRANFAQTIINNNSNCLVDSGPPHHGTANLQNLSLHSNYDGSEDVMLGDGKNLAVTHSGSTSLPYHFRPLYLNNVLCVPIMQKNLVFVYQLCLANYLTVEFSPFSFAVKDYYTGELLVAGKPKEGVYEWPLPKISPSSSTPTVNFTEFSTVSQWNCCLGHPYSPILHQTLHLLDIPIPSNISRFFCNSCKCNKMHKTSFKFLQ